MAGYGAPRGRSPAVQRRQGRGLRRQREQREETDASRGEPGGIVSFSTHEPRAKGSASIEPAVPRHGIGPSRAADGARRAWSPDELAKYPPCCVRGFGAPSLSAGERMLVGTQVAAGWRRHSGARRGEAVTMPQTKRPRKAVTTSDPRPSGSTQSLCCSSSVILSMASERSCGVGASRSCCKATSQRVDCDMF